MLAGRGTHLGRSLEPLGRCRLHDRCRASSAPLSSTLQSPTAANGTAAIVLERAPADIACDSIGWPDDVEPFRTLTFRIDSEAAEHVSVVSDTVVELETLWVPGFEPGPPTELVVRGPDGQVWHATERSCSSRPESTRRSTAIPCDAANDDGDARGLLAGRAGATTKSFSGRATGPVIVSGSAGGGYWPSGDWVGAEATNCP